MFIGQLNEPILLAAVGMGTMVLNMCGFGPYMGLNSGLETLAAQAIGAQNMNLAGTYLQRGRIVVVSAFFPMMLCFAFSK